MYLKEDEALSNLSSSKKRLAMLDLLIAAFKNDDIDEAGIREEVDTFMFEVSFKEIENLNNYLNK